MLSVLLAIACAVQSVSDVPSPRPTSWVADRANVIDDATERRLDALVGTLQTSRGIEVAIVTVDDVPGTPKSFATALFAHWGIGQAATNNGVLVLLVMGQRRLEIETGTGMANALPAAWLADMQTRVMVPRFKQRDFAGGLAAGVEAMVAHLSAAPGESAAPEDPATYTSTGSGAVVSARDDDRGTLALVGGGVAAAGIGGALFRRRRRRTCGTCKVRMLKLSEIEDDHHLTKGQQAEELFKSANYEVVVCPGCQGANVIRHGSWLSGWKRCSKCAYRTVKETSHTVREATYSSGGTIEIRRHCRHCDHRETQTRHTAARSRPSTTSYSSGSRSTSTPARSQSSSASRSSSSSSSRSSGYGGGRSSGGGSGSSW